MPYYIRVFGEKDGIPSLDDMNAAVAASGADAEVTLETGSPEAWEQVILRHRGGVEIAVVERNPVIGGELGREELDEFIAEVGRCKPQSAAEWLRRQLLSTTVIYAFQLLSGTDVDKGWDAVHALQSAVWNACGGVLQADGEGFSNCEGYHILWQFSDNVSGKWQMAVLDEAGKWVPFAMELGDRNQRAYFLAGKVPKGAKRL